MRVIDPGHIYELQGLGGGDQTLTFIKRSGGAIKYDKEWPGLQTQEVLRALIDRTKYLNDVLPCTETQDALWYLRRVLYLYELRAWRRKQEAVNREAPEHDDTARGRPWRELPHEAPFNEQDIELRPTGPDGHIILDES
jgi:hypothetical protein